MILKDDPRLNPSLALALKQFGMDEEAPGPPVKVEDPQEVKLGFMQRQSLYIKPFLLWFLTLYYYPILLLKKHK